MEVLMSIWTDINAAWLFFRSLRLNGNIPDDYVLDGPPPPKPEPELVDDWEESRGKWIEAVLCHCGYERVDPSIKVCPRCGHKDKWETKVGCWVSEYSSCRYKKALVDRTFYPLYAIPEHIYTRNKRFVLWTPEDCQVKEV
jgi:hypothetical protein